MGINLRVFQAGKIKIMMLRVGGANTGGALGLREKTKQRWSRINK